MKNPILACLMTILCVAPAVSSAAEIPLQNRERGELPGDQSAQLAAASLITAAQTRDRADGQGAFFPLEPFLALKDAQNPSRYHGLLLRFFDEDLAAMGKQLGPGACVVERFSLGRCRWIEVGVEANKLSYWSCRRNPIEAQCDGRRRRLEIHTMINWGDQWYVTHLAAPR